ncbi:hypothetical protein HOY82DRAFT_537719 [Tuber indicum]|nr:hypothetical protein HOY82DRAFT_537719 [Tuber indicum]
MPPISLFPIETLLSQFNKRDPTQNQGEDHSDAVGPAVMVGLVIAALTLLAAVIHLLRCTRFHRWLSSFTVLSFAKKSLGIITHPNPPPTATAAEEDPSTIPVAEIPTPGPILRMLCDGYSNAHFNSAHSNTSPYRQNIIAREDGRAPQVEEPLGLRSPEPVVIWRFSQGRHFVRLLSSKYS